MIELLRLLTILLGGALLGMSGAVFISYAKKVRQSRRPLLPRHVALISLSYCLLLVVVCVDQGIRLANNSTTTWRLVLVLPALVLGVAALLTILKSLRPSTYSGPERRARPR